jgi:adenine phosphoribosyltransferase
MNDIHITKLRSLIRDVPDFPKPGIVFKDITPLLGNPSGLALAVEYLSQPFRAKHIDYVVGAESRGFIFGTAVAQNLSAGFIPVRKPGKLPCSVKSAEYELEYGTDKIEIHEDALQDGLRVLVVDDLLATGGTMAACCELVRSLGADVVGIAVLIELSFLNGREKIPKYPLHSILTY